MKLIHVETIVGKIQFSSVVINHYAVFHKEGESYDSPNLSMMTGDKTNSFTEAVKESTSVPPLNNQTLFDLITNIEKTITGKIVIVPEDYDIKVNEKEIVINTGTGQKSRFIGDITRGEDVPLDQYD